MPKLNYTYLVSVLISAPILYLLWTKLSISPVVFLVILAALQPTLYFITKALTNRLQK
jgi:hypothetical protein